jgi:prepilin-type N-terminal cleavage/methylation domain-containing protein
LRCLPRAGLTLLEIIAAIAILGTILVGIVLAKSRHTRQYALSERKTAAVQAADRLISAWWMSPNGIPLEDSGLIEADESLTWQTYLVENHEIEQLGGRVVRVEIRETRPNLLEPDEGPLVAVELVLPEPVGSADTEDPGHFATSGRGGNS